MSVKLLIIFIVLNALNVIIQTVKSICTVKCGKISAALVNALAYGLYTVVLVYMVCDLSTWLKAVIVGGCNLIGVYIVKLLEEKMQKEKLWKVELTFKNKDNAKLFSKSLTDLNIPHNYTRDEIQTITLFNVYCYTRQDSKLVKDLANKYNAKYFVTETKTL